MSIQIKSHKHFKKKKKSSFRWDHARYLLYHRLFNLTRPINIVTESLITDLLPDQW